MRNKGAGSHGSGFVTGPKAGTIAAAASLALIAGLAAPNPAQAFARRPTTPPASDASPGPSATPKSAAPGSTSEKGDTGGEKPVEDLVWVSRPDGSVSCEPDSGQSLEKGAASLKAIPIEILASRKGHDGKMHIQMCGAETGRLNQYQIRRADLPKAIAAGFTAEKA